MIYEIILQDIKYWIGYNDVGVIQYFSQKFYFYGYLHFVGT